MATVPINTDIYQFGQWAQPNTRNIGDSLLDLYRMKREIENDKMAREEARMNLDLKKIAMQESLERAKQEREGQKKLADLFAPKAQVSPESAGAYKKGMGTAADMANAAMRIAGGMFGAGTPNTLPAIQPSFPVKQMMQGVTERAMTPETANLQDPQIQAQLLQIFANMPSKAGAVDDLIRATMRPESTALTPEQRMAELKYKADTKKALEDARAQVTREIVKMKQEGKSTLDKEHQERALTMALTVLNRGGEIKEALAYIQAYLKPPVTSGMLDGQPVQTVVIGNRAYPIVQGQGTPYQMPSSQTPSISPFTPTEGPVPEPAGAGAPPAAPATGPNAASMSALPPNMEADMAAARAANDSQALYQETPGEGAPASGSVQTPPATGTEVPKAGVLQPMPKAAKGALTEKDLQSIRMYWDRDTGKAMQTALKDYRRVEETIKTIEYKASRGEPVALDQMAAFWDAIRAIDNSVVRPGELQLFSQAQSIHDTFKNSLSRIGNDPAQVRLLTMQMSRDLAAMGRRAYRATYDAYEARKEGFVRQFAPPYVQSGLIDSENDFLAALNEAYKPEGVPIFEQGGKAAPGNPPAVEAGMSTPKWTKLSNGSWAWVSRDANGKPYMMGGK